MKRIAAALLIIIAAALLIGIGCSDSTGGGAPELTITYTPLTHRTWSGCPGDCQTKGQGTVKNIGGADAYNVHVWVYATCESFPVPVNPTRLSPGQSGSYVTGPFCGKQSPRVVPGCSDTP